MRQIEMNEPRLYEDFRLVNSPRKDQVEVVETAYDSVLCDKFTYVSTPITSGAVLYNVMKETGANIEELRKDKNFFFENVIKPNIDNANEIAHNLLKEGGAIITPAVFEAKRLGWDQDDYMGLWFDVIERKATRIALVDGWEYSNGGVEEYLHALLMQAGRRDRINIDIVDQRGNKVSQVEALSKISTALEDLMNRGFDPSTIALVFHRAISVWLLTSVEQDYGQCVDEDFNKKNIEYNSNFICEFKLLKDFLDKKRDLYNESMKFLSMEEIENKSSAQMMPSLIRETERSVLSEQKAEVIKN